MNRRQWPFLLLLLFCAIVFPGCEPTPCLQPPISTLGFAFYQDSAIGKSPKSIPATGLYIKQGNRLVQAAELLGSDPGTMAFARIQFPFPNLQSDFEIGWASDSIRDSLRFSAESTLLYGGESCGFYHGFRNLSLNSFGGNRIRRVSLNELSGDTSQKIHVEVYW
jgi:hypothetical protein